MRIFIWEFNPGFWPTAGVLLLLPLFMSLGFWQLDRAEQKRALHKEFEHRQNAAVIDLNVNHQLQNNFDELNWRKVTVEGAFSRGTNILLDNQVKAGVIGYLVYSPFKPKGQNVWTLVNRGWVPAGESREHLPQITVDDEMLRIFGSIKSPPHTGILLAENIIEHLDRGILLRVQKLELAGIEKDIGLELSPYVIRMDPESPGGLIRDWKTPGSGVERHQGYAFQWFAMATAIFLIYLILNIKPAK